MGLIKSSSFFTLLVSALSSIVYIIWKAGDRGNINGTYNFDKKIYIDTDLEYNSI